MVIELDRITTTSDQKDTFRTQGLVPLLHFFQEIEIWDERVRFTPGTRADLAYKNMLTARTPVIRKNREVLSSGYTIDYDDGYITFTTALVDGDEIRADYEFKYFTNDTLDYYLELALDTVNVVKPLTSYDYANNDVPEQWMSTLVELAYAHALETVLKDTLVWKAKLIWADPSAVSSYIQGIISRIYREWTMNRKAVKRRSLLRPRAVSTGRWQLPRQVNQSNWQAFTIIRN